MTARPGPARRALLLGGLGLGLVGCARDTPPATTPTPSTATPTPSTTAPPTPITSSTPITSTPITSTQTPAQKPARPSRDEIIDRYAGSIPAEWGTEVTGVVSTLSDLPMPTGSGQPRVALTFDACGGGGAGDGYDAGLIEVLRTHSVAATLFLNARWIAVHPQLAAELAADPLFLTACHGTRHVPLSVTGRQAYGIAGTGSVGEVYDELTGNIDWFVETTGRPPVFSRPGTAHCDEIAAAIARDVGVPVAGFSVNGDGGATFTAAMVRSTLLGVRDGDIVLAHANRPGGGTAAGCAEAIPRLLDGGVEFVRLEPLS